MSALKQKQGFTNDFKDKKVIKLRSNNQHLLGLFLSANII